MYNYNTGTVLIILIKVCYYGYRSVHVLYYSVAQLALVDKVVVYMYVAFKQPLIIYICGVC